ncbi:hypothetical protein MF628_004475 [Paenibacillus polymyxa]|uniref:hypothetical protein n=1 Tax=Paenibacillus polymyxa TaxID=1406 RepID=UPI00202593E0|nr:hypothetical protein [Paenibacillus polymyxa]URJ44728.1 hypothetical protein MF628_004475 [Paenibacillus polymyxa]
MNWNQMKLRLKFGSAVPESEGNFSFGIMCGLLISIVLWISIIGWIMLIFK